MRADTEPAEGLASDNLSPAHPDHRRRLDEFWDLVDSVGVRDSDLCRQGRGS